MSNGNISEYLRERSDANKLGLVCVVTPVTVVNLLNDPDPLSIPVVGCRSWVDLPTPGKFCPRELDGSKS